MKTTVDWFMFRDAFGAYDRKDNFSYEALSALWDYLENLEQELGEELELDVIGICCDFTEYKNLEAFQQEYSTEDYPTIESLQDETTVIFLNDDESGESGFVIQSF